jgi:hypothetical protein
LGYIQSVLKKTGVTNPQTIVTLYPKLKLQVTKVTPIHTRGSRVMNRDADNTK